MDTYHGKRDLGRQARMVELFRSGLTLEEVGDEFDLTRERVRQIITSAGVTASEGGATVKRAKRAAERAARIAERKRLRSQKAA